MAEEVDVADEVGRPVVVGVLAVADPNCDDGWTVGLSDSGIDRAAASVVVLLAWPAEPMVEELEIGAATSPPNLAPSRIPAATDNTAATASTVTPVATRARR